MNQWPESFVFECERDRAANDDNVHLAAEVRAPIDLRKLSAIGKALNRCSCGGQMVMRGRKAGES